MSDLDIPVRVRWCDEEFRQEDRAFPCTREYNHEGECDSQLAQERRTVHQKMLRRAKELMGTQL